MESAQQLEKYLNDGLVGVTKDIMKATRTNPRASIFMMRFAKHIRKRQQDREQAKGTNGHIPAFLIASITNQCNLHCKGCYARANHSCGDESMGKVHQGAMTTKDWSRVFGEAEDMGISFILLAGGEPLMRQDVLEEAGHHKKMMFPVFTNGTMVASNCLPLFETYPNLVPIISMEGEQETTDDRRGQGVYQRIKEGMEMLAKKSIVFGTSVTVTKENLKEVLSKEFVEGLKMAGAKAIIYVEYVPVDGKSRNLAPDDEARQEMAQRLDDLRQEEEGIVLLAFPGDEQRSGGCLAAGRGFFHINANGGAEPCPFSPYSDINVKTHSLNDALQSPLFCRLRESGELTKEHIGGCTLFEEKEQVEALVYKGVHIESLTENPSIR